jgi:type I restriction enzyme S subunit
MGNEWKEVKLEEVVDILGDGLHGTPKYDDKGEYFFINGNNLNGKIEINDKTKKVNKNEYEKYKKELNDRTVFVSINGTLGKVALYNGEKVMLGKSACYFNVKKNTDKQFIKYIMLSNIFKGYIQNYATGTTIKNIGLKQMREFPFKIPPLPTQKKIAEILSSLDDKIELNNQMNKTLEEMAQAIFKQWFVDFE